MKYIIRMLESNIDKKIKVVWFASSFVGRSASGTGLTARKIIENLIRNHADTVKVYLLIKNDHEAALLAQDKFFKQVEIIQLPKVLGNKFKSSRQFYKFSLLNRRLNFDILHFSVPRVYPYFWLFPAKKIVCTFHAGGDITVPSDKFVLSRVVYNFIIKRQWSKFDAIIADSAFGAKEISVAYKIPNRFITIIYVGADKFWDLKIKQTKRDPNLILVVGRWQRYKNLHTVINAFKKFEVPFNDKVRLIVIGKNGPIENELKDGALKGFPKNQIELIEYMTDKDLAMQYRKSSVVFHPSINEGFGLPAFEAFGEGARIIVHSGTPADEILSSQIGVISNNLLDERGVIQAYESIQAQNFGEINERRSYIKSISATWAQTTQKYIKLYQMVLMD